MTNGHWAAQEVREKEARRLYSLGRVQEADDLLGFYLHPLTEEEKEATRRQHGYIPPAPILSSTVNKIIDDWHNHQLILPAWFANNNINWVITGHITEPEFLTAFNNLLNSGIAYYVTTPEPTPPVVTPPPPP